MKYTEIDAQFFPSGVGPGHRIEEKYYSNFVTEFLADFLADSFYCPT